MDRLTHEADMAGVRSSIANANNQSFLLEERICAVDTKIDQKYCTAAEERDIPIKVRKAGYFDAVSEVSCGSHRHHTSSHKMSECALGSRHATPSENSVGACSQVFKDWSCLASILTHYSSNADTRGYFP
eukprot:sb/3475141/